MRITVSSRGIQITDRVRDYIEKKAKKLDKYFRGDPELQASLSQERGRYIVETTLHAGGLLLRAEVRSSDLLAGIDEALERLESQMHKHRTRLSRKQNKTGAEFYFESQLAQEAVAQQEEEAAGEIVRVKHFPLKPMDVEEAMLQMELLGHNFFVFCEASGGKVNVIYKRSDGNYGLIEPEY